MLYIVVERFKDGLAPAIYRRVRDKRRMMPDGLEYVSSWVDLELLRSCDILAIHRSVIPWPPSKNTPTTTLSASGS
ncbi:MAG: DUF3303 domain-containing protein [Armatimonadota bacterium]